MWVPSREQLERHHVWVSGDLAWQRGLRLMQALWREQQQLPIGMHPRHGDKARPLGSRIAAADAEHRLGNYLTDTIRQVVRDELEAAVGEQKLFSTPRIYDDLLSSQPLCFNLFGELKANLDVATALARHLWPDRAERVTRLEFEHSPGRGNPAYLGNRTAFDLYLEHTTPQGGQGFIGIEVKYHESLQVAPAEARERIGEVARASGVFSEQALPALSRPPLQQVWFDHLLALSMLQTDADRWNGSGLFVFLHPVANQASYQVVNRYERYLQRPASFQRLTLEDVVAALQLIDGRDWVDQFQDRYLAYSKTKRA
jgi:hypothetical protein